MYLSIRLHDVDEVRRCLLCIPHNSDLNAFQLMRLAIIEDSLEILKIFVEERQLHVISKHDLLYYGRNPIMWDYLRTQVGCDINAQSSIHGSFTEWITRTLVLDCKFQNQLLFNWGGILGIYTDRDEFYARYIILLYLLGSKIVHLDLLQYSFLPLYFNYHKFNLQK